MSEKLKNYVSTFHDSDLYIPRRTVTIFGEIDLDMYRLVFKNLHALDMTAGKINVIINSEGGDMTQGMAIYDAISGCQNPVRCLVYGEACSAASFIVQAGDEKLITPNAYMMLHIGEEATSGHPENKKRWDKKYQDDTRWLENIYLEKIKKKKPRFTRHKLKDMLRFDTILTAKKAVELGLIDKITTGIED